MRIKTQAEPEARENCKKEAFDHDLHGGRPTLVEQLRQENDHGAQPARRGH